MKSAPTSINPIVARFLNHPAFTEPGTTFNRSYTADDVDPSLIGTIHDPAICVDARPPTKAEPAAHKKAIARARPIRVKTVTVE